MLPSSTSTRTSGTIRPCQLSLPSLIELFLIGHPFSSSKHASHRDLRRSSVLALGNRSGADSPRGIDHGGSDGARVLSPREFTVGAFGSAEPLSLILPRTEYEATVLIGHVDKAPAAVFLSGELAFEFFICRRRLGVLNAYTLGDA